MRASACLFGKALEEREPVAHRLSAETLGWLSAHCRVPTQALWLFSSAGPGRPAAMARFRGARHLTCFYCGKKSGLRYDGVTRDFLCLYCDATNYLDEVDTPFPVGGMALTLADGWQNGELTDPPVATEREAAAIRYAASKPAAPTRSIFCATCLKNQHLFTKSLAQYFPDDPSDPDYVQLDRNYYRYRRGLEKRYPQVCDACAVEVEARIRQAGYTAKTDHLRRMMDLGRGRKLTAAKTALHRVHDLGRAMWRAGFVLQLFWHLTTVALVLQQSGDGLRDADRSTAAAIAGDWTRRATAVVPALDTLMRWSIGAAVASAWWNPHFVQLNRGFTRHLLGFTQWYCFQGLIILCRLVFRGVLVMDGGRGQSRHAQLSAHVAMAAVTTLVRTAPYASPAWPVTDSFADVRFVGQIDLCRHVATVWNQQPARGRQGGAVSGNEEDGSHKDSVGAI